MNALYTKGKEGLLDGSIKWTTDNLKVCLLDAGAYTANLATDKFLSDIPAAARIASSNVLTNRTATAGVADADDMSYPAISGPSIEAFVLYADTGVPTSSRLLAYFDTGTGLPFTTNGGEVDIIWPSDGNGIFKL